MINFDENLNFALTLIAVFLFGMFLGALVIGVSAYHTGVANTLIECQK